jgi:hypothetical protein
MAGVGRRFLWVLILIIGLITGAGAAEGGKFILLSSTIGPIDSGVVDLLEERFEKETGIGTAEMEERRTKPCREGDYEET